jgi:hypothetical protein
MGEVIAGAGREIHVNREAALREQAPPRLGFMSYRQRSADTALVLLRRGFLPGGHGKIELCNLKGRV